MGRSIYILVLWVASLTFSVSVIWAAKESSSPQKLIKKKKSESELSEKLKGWLDEGNAYVADWEWTVNKITSDNLSKDKNIMYRVPKLLARFASQSFDEKLFKKGKRDPLPLGHDILANFTYDPEKKIFTPLNSEKIDKTSRPPMIQFFFGILDQYEFKMNKDGEFITEYGGSHKLYASYTYEKVFEKLLKVNEAYLAFFREKNKDLVTKGETSLELTDPLQQIFSTKTGMMASSEESVPLVQEQEAASTPDIQDSLPSKDSKSSSFASSEGPPPSELPQVAPVTSFQNTEVSNPATPTKGFQLNDPTTTDEPPVKSGGFKFGADSGS
jgi:hypothetical protein